MTKSDPKPNILYKVVSRDSDGSYSSFCGNTWLGQYCRKYVIGRITEGIPGSLGILCFKIFDAAFTFAQYDASERLVILEVKPLAEVYDVPRVYHPGIMIERIEFLYENQYELGRKAPYNTVGCMKIKVLGYAKTWC